MPAVPKQKGAAAGGVDRTLSVLARCTFVALLATVPVVGVAEAEEPRLTCSFVAEQCHVECRKEAGPLICNLYCTRNRDRCFSTGDWVGRFGDVYRDVEPE